MNASPGEWPVDVRRRLDRYLDAVEQALARSDMPREERRCVVDEIESQARDMLLSRTAGAPAPAALESVLTEMDPPEAYAADAKMPGDAVAVDGFDWVLPGRAWFWLGAALLVPMLAVALEPHPPMFLWFVVSAAVAYGGLVMIGANLESGPHDRVVLGVLMALCPTLMVLSVVIAGLQLTLSGPLWKGFFEVWNRMDTPHSAEESFLAVLIQYGVWVALTLVAGGAAVHWTARWLDRRWTPPSWLGTYRAALASPMLPFALILVGWVVGTLIANMGFPVRTAQGHALFLVGWLGTTQATSLVLALLHISSRSGRVATGLAAASVLLVVARLLAM